MKISIAQMDITQGHKGKNLKKGISFIEEAAEQNADLIVLPELWTTGYVKNLQELAEPMDGETITKLTNMAKENDITIMGTVAERAERYYNTMHLITPRGLKTSYRKMHLFSLMNEARFFEPGETAGIYENIGMLICYDLRFPELSRKLVMSGAQMLIVSAEWPYPRLDHWRTLLKARAIENLIYVVGCNRVGTDKTFEYFGHSTVIDPWGKRLIEGEENETLLTCEIDPFLVSKARKEFPALKDMKMRE